jgi:hypothetical protein
MQRLVFASVVVLIGFSVAVADEFSAIITKVDGNNVSFKKTKKGEKPGEEMTLPAADNVKVNKGKFNKDDMKFEVGAAIEGGLKGDILSKDKLGEKGINARITTDDGKIAQILITGGGKKKKKDAQ